MDKELVKKVIHKHGTVTQSMIAMEECSELIQAISKCLRSKDLIPTETREHLIEEMADVTICLEQLMVMYSITFQELDAWIERKELRLKKREGLKE